MSTNNYKFIKTKDGSTGLYDKKTKDILHSNSGALKEAYEKFIVPSNIKNYKGKIKILDICYGIGYNSKSAIYSSNSSNIDIDAVEIDKELIFLSPFIEDLIDDLELKLRLIEILICNPNLNNSFCSFINEYENFACSYFTNFMRRFKELILNCGYKTIGLNNNLSFLHNIYCQYIK